MTSPLCWLIYTKKDAERNRTAIGFYEKALQKRGILLHLLYYENFTCTKESVLYEGKVLPAPNFVIMRAREPVFSAFLEDLGYLVFNNSYLSFVANDKAKTVEVAQKAGIPVPKTLLCDGFSARENALQIGYPLVIKPRDGHGGQDVLWIENQAVLVKTLTTYPHKTFLLQEPVTNLGKDLRVYVLGNQILYPMLRVQTEDFRSNFCLGGQAQPYTLSEEELSLVQKTISLFSVGFAGFDFMFHKGQMVLNEIEDVVGARMLYACTDLDPVDLYVDYITTLIGLNG